MKIEALSALHSKHLRPNKDSGLKRTDKKLLCFKLMESLSIISRLSFCLLPLVHKAAQKTVNQRLYRFNHQSLNPSSKTSRFLVVL